MMKKTVLFAILVFSACCVSAGPGYRLLCDIPYYDADMERTGDPAYIAERCKLDIYMPEQAAKAPVVIYFHGGGMTAGKKFIPEGLKRSGLIVVAPNYRLSSDRARCPDYLYDAAAAACWVFRHIAEYGGDPDSVFVTGASAGAYLAAMIGMAPAYLAKFGESNRRFAALMPISGQMTTHFQILKERNTPASPSPVIDQYAPLYHASKELPPIILFAGDPQKEWPARAEENLLLAAVLTKIAGHPDTTVHLFSGFDHGSAREPAYILIKKYIAAGKSKNK